MDSRDAWKDADGQIRLADLTGAKFLEGPVMVAARFEYEGVDGPAHLQVSMPPDFARRIAGHLVEMADRVDRQPLGTKQ